MIFIVVKFTVRPEYADSFLAEVADFTAQTRSEEGVLWFDWSVNVENPRQFVLVEAFRDAEAGRRHVSGEHFRDGIATFQRVVAKTPEIINVEIPGATGWSAMGEVTVQESSSTDH